MVIGEVVLASIVDAVIAYAFEQGADNLGTRVREKLGRDPTKKAFKEALDQAVAKLSDQHPQWVSENFDASFFKHEGAPILAQFLVLDGRPDPSDLAEYWADSLNIKNPERRTFYISELEPIAVDFLENLAHQLKGKEALRELNIGRSLDQTTEALQALRQQFGADKATFGTRRDYLHWLIGRNYYLDPRGTFQTQRQVQVKLDEVYISLQAQQSEIADETDLQDLEKELADLETRRVISDLAAEELEDRRDFLQTRLMQKKLVAIKQSEVFDLAEVVIRNDRVVILGDPGSGKSTLLRYLALKHAQALRDGCAEAGKDLGTVHFPILIRIAEYAEDGIWKRKSLSDFLVECCIMHDCPRTGLGDLLQGELDKGNCLVMLDGLDEIISAEERLGIVRQVEDFVRRYSRYSSKANRFVITSRIAGYHNAPLGEPFVNFTVQEMNETQIHRFLEHWCQAVENAQTPELSVQERQQIARREINGIMRAAQNPGVQRLAANPLLLRILALIHRTGAKLPQKRIELYKLAADTLAHTWRPAQGVAESDLVKESALLKEEYLTPLLSKLAYWLHLNKSTGIATEREVYEVLGEEWARLNEMHWDADDPSPKIKEEVRKFIAAVHEHTGLFVERAPKRYGFIHLTFEEYYVARYLAARRKMVAKLIRQHLHQPRWEEPVLLALGFIGLEYPAEASELVETSILAEGEEAKELGFVSSKFEDLLGQDFLFALRCLGDSIPVRPRLLRRLIERLMDELFHNGGSARYQRYRDNLQEKLAHLGGSEGGSVIQLLLVTTLQGPEVNMRYKAVQSLGWLGQASTEVVSALIAALQDPEARVRSGAVVSLGQLGREGQASTEVVSALIAALQDPTGYVRYNAAVSLGREGQASTEVVSALIAALQDPAAGVRSGAIVSLGQLGRQGQASTEVVSALIAALQDPEAGVRSGAAESLGQQGQASTEVVSALIAALQDPTGYVRYNAAVSLGQLGQASTEVVSALIAALQDPAVNVRSGAAESLGQLGQDQASTEVVSALIAALRDPEGYVRYFAAESLGLLGQASTEVVSALIAALQDPEGYICYLAARSLGQLGQASTEVVSALIAALQDPEADVRSGAIVSLGQLGQASTEVVSALIAALQDPAASVRSGVAGSLGQLGQASTEVVSALIAALQDPAVNVRYNAAVSLGRLGQASTEVVSALIAVLQDPTVNVRYFAAESLGQLGQASTEVVSALIAALQDPEAGVRSGAAVSLGQLGQASTEVVSALIAALRDPDASVRSGAAESLGRLGQLGQASTEVVSALIAALQDPNYELADNTIGRRPAYDYAYEVLWSLVVSIEVGRRKE